MNRRGFLRSMLAVAVHAACPAVVAPLAGVLTLADIDRMRRCVDAMRFPATTEGSYMLLLSPRQFRALMNDEMPAWREVEPVPLLSGTMGRFDG